MDGILKVISNIIIIIGLVYMLFGVIGMFKFKTFYPRVLTTSKADTVGALTVMIGVAIGRGISFFSGRVLLLMVITLILNPLMAHIIARAAYLSGHEIVNPIPKEKGD
jgi:multicomponent Na+:H+ antiporter subunit G